MLSELRNIESNRIFGWRDAGEMGWDGPQSGAVWLGVDKDWIILSEEYFSKTRGELVPPIQVDGLTHHILPWVVIH